MENRNRNIKLVTTKEIMDYLVSEPPSYHTTRNFSDNLLAIEMKKIQILMKKLVYFDLSKSKMSKIVMYEF